MNTEHKSDTPVAIRDLWQTPKFLFDYYNELFNFGTDMAASDTNHLCDCYFTKERSAFDAELIDYAKGSVWLNPPFSDVTPWIEEVIIKSGLLNRAFVALLPADTSVKWFKLAFDNCTECHFISGRISFINAETQRPVNGNNKGSVVFIFDPRSPVRCSVSLIDRDGMK